jgi:hypothetical protein
MTNGKPLSPIYEAMKDSPAEREYAARQPVEEARMGDDLQPVDIAEIARLTGTAPENEEVDRLAQVAREVAPKT